MTGYSPRLARLAHLRKADLLARYLLLVAPARASATNRGAVAGDTTYAANLSRDQLIARLLEAGA